MGSAVMVGMITVGIIRNGANYLSHHLRKNDYWTEGEKAVLGAWTYGHALTSYRSQGSTSEESLLVLGEVATQALARRQFYVGNTRFRGAHAIYLSNKDEILRRIVSQDTDRELATEFMERHGLAENEHLVPRPVRVLGTHLRNAWLAAAEKLRRTETQSERQRI